MRVISDYHIRGKRILLRVDLNSPVENGKIVSGPRIEAHSRTIKELSENGAKVIVLAHQGRIGKEDFLHLEQHAKLLHHIIKREVIYCDDLIGEKARHAIEKMKDSDILVLENVRTLSCETDESIPGKVVGALVPLVDYFVLDALSVAHRKHSSVVEFMDKLPSFAGPVLANELKALEKLRNSKDVLFFFGGSKVEDSFKIMKKWLNEKRERKILVGGALATLLLHAKGYKVAESMEFLLESNMESHCEDAKELLKNYGQYIMLPVDVGLSIEKEIPGTNGDKLRIRENCDVDKIKRGQIWDIGPKTAEVYKEAIFNSHAIVMNGPAGVYEIEDYSFGTKTILEAIAQCDAFSLLGGGHTITALQKFGLDWKHFGYVSLSGKALIEYLCGKSLPALVALEENARKFNV